MGRGGARRPSAAALTCWMAIAAGCEPSVPRLATLPHLALEVERAATLHVSRSGVAWVGAPGRLVRADAADPVSISMPGAGAPRVALEGETRIYAVSKGEMWAIRPDSAQELSARRAGFGDAPVMLDPRERFLAQGAASGAVLGFDPETLEAVWAWAALGAATAGIAATPEGDVVWQALSDPPGSAILLERDLQTGRVLDQHDIAADVVFLAVTPGGDLLLVTADGERLHAVRMQPRGRELEPVWREAVELGGDAAPLVRFAPAAELLAIFRPGSDTGLRVVDTEAGVVVGTVEDTPLDAAFSAEGVLYVLRPREIRRVVVER